MKYFLLSLLSACTAIPAFGHVKLNTPQGGESLIAGETITITWEVVIMHDTQNWDILFSSDGGLNWTTVETDIHLSELSYNWLVPQIPTSQGRIRIVQDNTGVDYDDMSGDFTITLETTGVEEEHAEAWKLYPNPVTYSMTITGPGSGCLEIFNSAGILMQRKNIVGEQLQVSMTGYPAGVYYLDVISGGEIRVFKVFKR